MGLKDLSFKGRGSWMDFNIDLHPTLNFLVGNLTIATLAQAPSLRPMHTTRVSFTRIKTSILCELVPHERISFSMYGA
jgi:hypothetical protein